MKHLLKTLGALGLLSMAFMAQAESVDFGPFDTSQDAACWVAPEWRD